MYYHKFHLNESAIIEFHNNWLGVEFVFVNGQEVSRITSVWGAHHHFNIIEDGHVQRFVLTTKVNSQMQILLDLKRNGQFLEENVLLKMGGKPKAPINKAKKEGLALLQEYDIDNALITLQKALDISPNDPEIHFHIACACSIMEDTKNGFEAIRLAVKNNLKDPEMIFTHDMLAFLRMHIAFQDFADSNFSEYDGDLF